MQSYEKMSRLLAFERFFYAKFKLFLFTACKSSPFHAPVTCFPLLATLEDSTYDLQFEHRIILPVFDKLGDVISIIAHCFVQHLVDFHLLVILVNLQGSHKLASQFHTYTYALLGNQSAEAQTQIRTEGITADVAMDIEVIVQLHVIISQSHADQVKDFLLVSWILAGESLNLVTMTAQLGDFRIAE